jgi:UDP-glucose 4-epimerase
MTILVTGGSGYIGSHVVLELMDSGKDFLFIDNHSSGKWVLDSIKSKFIYSDLLDYDHLFEALKEYNIESIIHLASKSIVEESMANPTLYHHYNITSSLNLLKLAVAKKVNSFIFSSTASVYGLPKILPIKETASLNPINPYGFSKMIIEKCLEDIVKRTDLNAVIFRYFNVAGSDPQLRSGESHDPETHLIPNIIKGANKVSFKINIFGNDYPTKDGTCIRDYIHVSDIAKAHNLGLEWIEKNKGFNIFNLGSGEGYSIYDVINATEDALEKKAVIEILDRRSGDPAKLVADPKKAIQALGWKRKYDINDMVRHAYQWMKVD